MSGVVWDKATLRGMSEGGFLSGCVLGPSAISPGRWVMVVELLDGGAKLVLNRRGGVKLFSSLDTAVKYAKELGFLSIRIDLVN